MPVFLCKKSNSPLQIDTYTEIEKVLPVSRPQPGCHGSNSPWARIIKLFLASESLISDIPAGDGKVVNLFTVYRSICIHRQ
jgi:hypothetical protein